MDDLGAPLTALDKSRARPGDQITGWLLATLALSLVPYAILLLAYHALEGRRRWLSFYELFGKGDLALVVLTVVGATAAEVVLAENVRPMWRTVCLLPGLILAFIAVGTFTVAQYQVLQHEQPDSGVNAVVLSSCLAVAVSLHVLLMLHREK